MLTVKIALGIFLTHGGGEWLLRAPGQGQLPLGSAGLVSPGQARRGPLRDFPAPTWGVDTCVNNTPGPQLMFLLSSCFPWKPAAGWFVYLVGVCFPQLRAVLR